MGESKGGLLAALTRRAADYIKFPVKTTPIAADILLIEDSANSDSKAYTTAGAIAQTVLTSTAPSDISRSAAVVGSATDAARANHKHDISTAAASAAFPGDIANEGSATSLARSDHIHSLPSFGSLTGSFCQGNDSRLTNNRTPTSHATTHQNGGTDEVATATATANSIPKTGAATTLAIGWIPLGTTASTVCIGDDSRLADDRTASGLRTATTVVSVSAATAPTFGQVLTATSTTTAIWSSVSEATRFTSVAIANTETRVVGFTATANTLAAGTIYNIHATGLWSNTNANTTSTLRFRIGTTTLTGNIAAGITIACGATARTNIPFSIHGQICVVTAGAAGTALGFLSIILPNATQPIIAAVTTAAVAVDTTADKQVELTYISGLAGNTVTWHNATIIQFN